MRRHVEVSVEFEIDGQPVAGFPYRNTLDAESTVLANVTQLNLGASYIPTVDDPLQPATLIFVTADGVLNVRLGDQIDGNAIALQANGLFLLVDCDVRGVSGTLQINCTSTRQIRSFLAGEYVV